MQETITRRLVYFLVILLVASQPGCRLIDPAEDIPSYIRIERIDLVNVNTVTQGTASQQITEGWVYVDNQLIGGFELPAVVPVLASGSHDVKIVAGIIQNGISSTRAIYPYFQAYDTLATLTRGEITTLTPRVEYFTTVQFPWLDSFENGNNSIVDLPSAPFLEVFEVDDTSGNAYEGNGCGYVHLDNDTFDCQVQSADIFSLPSTSGQKIFMELHYKCNNPFVIGVITNLGEYRPWLTVNPSENWNKIYVDLTSTVYTAPVPTSYRVFIATNKAVTLTEADLYFDNIKLLHF